MTQPLFEVKTHVSRESCRAQARAKAGQHNRMTWVVTIMTAFAVAILWAIGSFHAWWVTALLMLLVLDNLLRVRLTGWRMYSARRRSSRMLSDLRSADCARQDMHSAWNLIIIYLLSFRSRRGHRERPAAVRSVSIIARPAQDGKISGKFPRMPCIFLSPLL